MFSDCIAESIHPATWAVLALKRTPEGPRIGHRGTAFSIDCHGHLVTCWHVTFWNAESEIDAESLAVMQPEIDLNTQYEVDLVGRDKTRDAAILRIKDRSIQTDQVSLYEGERVPYGSNCATFGHPLSAAGQGGLRIFTRTAAGVLSMPYVMPRFPGCGPIRLYELDYFTHGGSSGGSVFLPDGRVFGMVSGSWLLGEKKRRSNLSVAIDIAEVLDFVKSLDIELKRGRHIGRRLVPINPKHWFASLWDKLR